MTLKQSKPRKLPLTTPCMCGSGKPFGSCHYPKLKAEMGFGKPERHIDAKGRTIGRPFIQMEYKGARVRAIGSRIYPHRRIDETFHEFIIEVLKGELGDKWGNAELAKPPSEQHLIVQWLRAWGDLVRSSDARVENDRGLKSVEPNGAVQSLMCLAYDIYSVLHCGRIPSELKKRLRHPDQFQGARYELGVAATFVRAGFRIKWVTDKGSRHCEFVATHTITKEQIAVEAKSRTRPGVLGAAGEPKEMRADVNRIFKDALSQSPGTMPFIIFLDLNLPLTPNIPPHAKAWIQDIKNLEGIHRLPTSENPDPLTALFVTNFSWHYAGNERAGGGEHLFVAPLYAQNPLRDNRTFPFLIEAVSQYGKVPPEV